jgi:hypothetical protein
MHNLTHSKEKFPAHRFITDELLLLMEEASGDKV